MLLGEEMQTQDSSHSTARAFARANVHILQYNNYTVLIYMVVHTIHQALCTHTILQDMGYMLTIGCR